jgi:adenosylmethionine-8-amino-7-oxononanoate aminotransferase
MDPNGHADSLSRDALRHLWLHFTGMGDLDPDELQIIVRGEGCYLEDEHGRRYLDALAGLFCVNAGYSYGAEMGEAAASQMRELPFAINWTFAHPRSIELAAELARLAPGDINRAFFVSGGSEAVEAAWKVARQYHSARGERRWKAIARRVAYHGTTMGALSINGCTELRTPFEPLVPDVLHVSNTNRYRRERRGVHGPPARRARGDDPPGGPRDGRDGDHGAGAERGRVVHAARRLLGGRARALRPLRHQLCADEVITSFGRLGHWFAAERFDIRPDMITTAKGLSSAYAAIGALLASDRVMEPFERPGSMFTHGMTFGGHPVQAAVALKNIEIMRREGIVANVAERQDEFHAALSRLLELPIVGDLRGSGYFYALELVKDSDSRESFSDDECNELLRGFLSPELFMRGLICRADDRGDPVVQISPPLVAGPDEFEEIVQILGGAPDEACERMAVAR